MNINFGLIPPIEKKLNKSQKKKYIYDKAIEKINHLKVILFDIAKFIDKLFLIQILL